jgi:hypothetical protein
LLLHAQVYTLRVFTQHIGKPTHAFTQLQAQVKQQHSRVQAAALVAPALLVVKPVGQAWQASWLPPAL